MLPTFSNLLGSVANIPGVIMRITVHYTRVEKNSAFAPEGAKQGGTSLDAQRTYPQPIGVVTSTPNDIMPGTTFGDHHS